MNESPTTSIFRVLMTLTVAFLVAILLGARGIVHSAMGMDDGPMRRATLAVGQSALHLAEVTHLTWPWDRAEIALGRQQQPSLPPLLASRLPVLPRSTTHIQTQHVPRVKRYARSAQGQPSRRAAGHPVGKPAGHAVKQPAARHPATRPPALPPLRRPTRQNPLRLLVTGDSLTDYIGPELVDEASRVGPVRGIVDNHDGTGLTRPDFVDWSVVARQQVAAHNPNAVVIMLGGNDFQNMTLPPNQFFRAGSPAWTREYQRRAEICMRIWSRNGAARVYWLSIPPARYSTWAWVDAHINLALQRAAAQVPGAEYVNILGRVTDHGRYADFVTDRNGQTMLVRAPDGVHLNITGSILVAQEVLPVLEHDWHLGGR